MRPYLPFGKPDFSELEIAAVTRVMRSGWVGMGPETLRFEEELAAYLAVPHVVTVNSCTSALFLALLVHGVGPGDEVICPSLTWCSTANAALYLGARPVFCDVDPHTLCLTPQSVLARLTPRTRAVMVVHFGGWPVDVHALRAALPPEVALIEDAAHALTSRFADGTRVGASGFTTCFSFYANKSLSTAEGGAVATPDGEVADRIRSLRQHGLSVNAWKRFTAPRRVFNDDLAQLGYKMNYTDLQASIGRVQLQRQEAFFERRLAVARIYAEGLDGLPLALQAGCVDPRHARHLFVIVLDDRARLARDDLLHAMRDRNLGATIHYEPLHAMPLYNPDAPPPALPATERIAGRILTLPIGASVTDEDAREVVSAMRELLA